MMEQLILIEISPVLCLLPRCLKCGVRIRDLVELRLHLAEAGEDHTILRKEYFTLCGMADSATLINWNRPGEQ